jgi:hypothetical protein
MGKSKRNMPGMLGAALVFGLIFASYPNAAGTDGQETFTDVRAWL